ncbi:MAG: hypothetical protein K0R54_999 [Clostridiaceae bacterium]|jgi:hypothetical protein|nr:hypothetical protein [Clostridiaceae bacterium]
MEREKDTNIFVREMGSYEISDGAEFITKLYYDGDKVNVFFDTQRDVEEWEYSAIFQLFPYDTFNDNGLNIDDIDDEYNPTWQIKFDYIDDHEGMEEKLKFICNLIDKSMTKVFEDIKVRKDEYI